MKKIIISVMLAFGLVSAYAQIGTDFGVNMFLTMGGGVSYYQNESKDATLGFSGGIAVGKWILSPLAGRIALDFQSVPMKNAAEENHTFASTSVEFLWDFNSTFTHIKHWRVNFYPMLGLGVYFRSSYDNASQSYATDREVHGLLGFNMPVRIGGGWDLFLEYKCYFLPVYFDDTATLNIERIIASIDEMLKGDQTMDFTVFDETELRNLFADMLQNMNESQKQLFIDHYGSIEEWEKHMIEGASDEKTQRNYAKVVEWYGNKEAVKESLKQPPKSKVFTAYQKRICGIQKKLADLKGTDVSSFEIRQLVGEYDFVAKQLYQVEDARPLLMDIAKGYQENEEVMSGVDSVYGDGSAKYIGEAIEAFYSR